MSDPFSMVPSISHLTLAVGDVERARGFYAEGFGWGPLQPLGDGLACATEDLVLVLHPRSSLQRVLTLPAGSLHGHGVLLSLNLASRNDVDRLVDRLVRHGGRLLRPPSDLPWGGYAAVVADPDGHPWELVHPPSDDVDD